MRTLRFGVSSFRIHIFQTAEAVPANVWFSCGLAYYRNVFSCYAPFYLPQCLEV